MREVYVLVNPNYNQTITLYNCLSAHDNDDSVDKWQRTVLENCFYKSETTEVQSGTQATKANTYTVRIPCTENTKYKSYNEWKNLSNEERTNYFTLSDNDIVVKGVCVDEIEGSSVVILQKNKPDAFKITSVSDNTSHRMGKHYRVGG